MAMTTFFVPSISELAFIKISDNAATTKFSLASLFTSVIFVYVTNRRCFKKKAYTAARIPHGPPSF
jgi:hypothetical protein